MASVSCPWKNSPVRSHCASSCPILQQTVAMSTPPKSPEEQACGRWVSARADLYRTAMTSACKLLAEHCTLVPKRLLQGAGGGKLVQGLGVAHKVAAEEDLRYSNVAGHLLQLLLHWPIARFPELIQLVHSHLDAHTPQMPQSPLGVRSIGLAEDHDALPRDVLLHEARWVRDLPLCSSEERAHAAHCWC